MPRLLMLTSVLWISVSGTLRADIGTALIPLLVGADGVIQEYRNAVSHLDSGEVLKGIRKIQVLHETVWGNNPQMEADFSDNWRVVRPLSTRIIERLRALTPEQQQMYRKEFGARDRCEVRDQWCAWRTSSCVVGPFADAVATWSSRSCRKAYPPDRRTRILRA